MVSFPSKVASSSNVCLCSAMTRLPATLWVVVPFALGVLLMLNTSIGWGMGSRGSFDCCAKDLSIKSSSVPESIRALVLSIWFPQVIDIEICIDCLNISATITGETVTLGQCS